MSASTDTIIHIWDLKGEVLASINTNQITNSYAAISPCGRSVPPPPSLQIFHVKDQIESSLRFTRKLFQSPCKFLCFILLQH